MGEVGVVAEVCLLRHLSCAEERALQLVHAPHLLTLSWSRVHGRPGQACRTD